MITEPTLNVRLAQARDWAGALIAEADADGGLSRLINRAVAGDQLDLGDLTELERRLQALAIETLSVREPVGWPWQQMSMADHVTMTCRQVRALLALETSRP